MRRLALALLLLAACREETARPDPVALTPEAVGHYCQMNLLEHPGPKAQVHLDFGPPLFFSQVRDALAYQRMPEQSAAILAVYVNDMGAPGASWQTPGALNWIPAEGASYVEGSDAAGGMGAPELVPFAEAAEAEAFAARHGGRVVTLDEVPDEALLAPAEAGDEADYEQMLGRLPAPATE
ncbi:nitrous oxide reductase accessory protein NosL (plasmid) [Cereibacter sphaeroides f. sp. denitrificans]|uniref:NosL n=1 Tax=Cereibacter sphaeroides f. sp. denitrificans TaxID=39723 RepID=Q9XCW7_CERSP|nr:NosL [Cereibacter sphaeroides f. sp. denitrificans]RDS96626.1 copper resistance protein CopZ [Cereibacter sphaeroides f. sp. denitrificans]